MTIHVFVDNSNIFGGAQRAAKTREAHVPWQALRIYYRNLFSIVENSRACVSRILGGSVPPGNEALWEHARNCGYATDLLKRVESDNGRLVEQGVDEVLHLKIAEALLDHDGHTLVMLTGDGNESDFGTAFAKQAERALKRGWDVEVWSWKEQLSGTFRRMRPPGGSHGKITVNELDPFYNKITFVKGGDYETSSGRVSVVDRIVEKHF